MYDFPPYSCQPAKEHVLLVNRVSPLASIVKLPSADSGKTNLSYEELPCSEQDRVYIGEIITTMAENGKLSLLLKQSHLKQLGAEINHVHPLKFLSTIFTNPRLKGYMPQVFDDYFKRNGFLDGLGPSLTKEADRKKLDQYAEQFAKEVNAPVDQIRGFFESRDWEGLVYYLIAL